MPLLRDEQPQIHDEIFGEVTYHAAYEPMRSIRTTRYTLIKRFGERRRHVLPNWRRQPEQGRMDCQRGRRPRSPRRRAL